MWNGTPGIVAPNTFKVGASMPSRGTTHWALESQMRIVGEDGLARLRARRRDDDPDVGRACRMNHIAVMAASNFFRRQFAEQRGVFGHGHPDRRAWDAGFSARSRSGPSFAISALCLENSSLAPSCPRAASPSASATPARSAGFHGSGLACCRSANSKGKGWPSSQPRVHPGGVAI